MKQHGWKMVVLVFVVVICAFGVHWGARALEAFTSDDISQIDKFSGMVVFLMEGCGYCKSLKAEVLDKLTDKMNILTIRREADGADKLIEKWNVTGFPTIYFLKNGVKMLPPGTGDHGEYEGPRDLDTIRDILTKL